MTYQEIVNRIQFITSQHKMLVDFGYGDLSDLKSRFENNSGDSAVQADYPYLFLNPGVHGRNQGMVTYNFNMVVMDMAREEVSDQPYNNMLAIQSQCQQYIDDVLAYLYFEYKDNPDVIYSGVTYIPFNERFQDNVAGMTATLTIQVPQSLDNCVAPFGPSPEPPTVWTQFSYNVLNGDVTRNVDGNTASLRFETQVQTDIRIARWPNQWLANEPIPADPILNQFKFDLVQIISFVEPLPGESLPLEPVARFAYGTVNQVLAYPTNTSGNWPTTWTSTDPITYTATYIVQPLVQYAFNDIFIFPVVGGTSNVILKDQSTLTISYSPPA